MESLKAAGCVDSGEKEPGSRVSVQPKTIYVDMDDVVSITTETYPDVIEQEFGKIVSFDDLTCFDLKTCFNLTDAEFRYFFGLVHQPDFLLGFKPVSGAVQSLQAWVEAGHTIDIVTGRPTSAHDATLAWLEKNGVPFRGFIMVDKYNRPGNNMALAITKDELAMMPYDLAVEDSPEMAMFLAKEMGVSTALIHKPWNRACSGHNRMTRCTSWEEVFSLANEEICREPA